MTRIRVLVADDHAMVRAGLCALLRSCPDMEVVGEAADGDEAVVKAQTLRPDVVVMDLVMPRKSGLEAIREILNENPRARVLAVTSFAQDRKTYQAVQAGALGYLLKDASSDEFVRTIREVSQGKLSLEPEIALRVAREVKRLSTRTGIESLTPREVEVLRLIAQGLSNNAIAVALALTEMTVGGYVSTILSKLNLESRTQAALFAIREGLSDVGPE